MHDYYLDQMGIERWVRRPLSVPYHSVLLLAISKENVGCFDGKAQVLFKRMLECIGLDISQAHVTTERLWQIEFERHNPRVLWVMTGSDWVQKISELNKPTVVSNHIHDLLLNPIDKKQVYPQLLELRQFL